MARPQSVAGGRPVRVTVNLSVAEAARLDRLRGSLSQAEFLRTLMVSIDPEAQKVIPPARSDTTGDTTVA